jgi:hypothetical protein
VSTDVSQEHIASIFRVEKISPARNQQASGWQACLLAGFLLKLFLETLMMEATCSSETSVDTQQITPRHFPEDDTLHNHRCENLKSYQLLAV